MNCALTMVKKSLVLNGNQLEIYHAGFIETRAEYDLVIFAATHYLHLEGFLEDRDPALTENPEPPIENFHVFDYAGKQVSREKCGL